jgi:quinohemoprotein ethanol dehydrogenase
MSGVLDVGWKYGMQPRRLLTFALDGTTKLPPSPPRDMKVNALDDPDLVINEADVQVGKSLSLACMSCHGAGFRGAGAPGPDLRESAIALRLDTFTQMLKEGRLDKGMPQFKWMTDEQIRQLHAYLRARARESLGLRKPAAPPQAPASSAPGRPKNAKGPVTY